MNNDGEAFKKIIDEQISLVLRYEKGTAQYKTAVNKLIEVLYKYCEKHPREIYREDDDAGAIPGLEFVEVGLECIKYYNPEKGDFLKYFLSSLGRALKQKRGRDIFGKMHGGMKIGKAKREKIRKYLEITKNESQGNFEDIAQSLGITATDIDFYRSNAKSLDENEKEGIFHNPIRERYADSYIIEKESLITIINAIERTFLSIRKDQRAVVSMMITAEIIEQLHYQTDVLKYAKELSFFNEEIYNRYMLYDKIPTAKEVAEIFGRHESSISRTMKGFKIKLRQEMYKKQHKKC